MDPLSAIGAASSVVGVASFGIQLSQALYKFTSQALSAKESLQTILSGVHATACALNQVHGILVEECEYRERKGRAILFSAKAIEDVRGTADKCLIIFWRIEATIANKTTRSNFEEQLNERLKKFNEELSKKKHPDPLNVDTTSISLSRWERLRWPYITPKLEDYNNQLQRLQLNLVLMFSVISLGAHRMKP
jgi:hypothetical protein